MNSVKPSTAAPRDGGRLPDDLDGLLRAFFRAEMPPSWPGFEPPHAAVAAPGSPPRPLGRSRLALAASVAFLLLGQLSLSSTFQDLAPFAAGAGEGGVAGRAGRPKPMLHKADAPRARPAEEGDWLPEGLQKRR